MIMDIDHDEVTREPFEEVDYNETESSPHLQYPHDTLIGSSDDQEEETRSRNKFNHSTDDLCLRDFDRDSTLSTPNEEDISYASAFGIQLRRAKIQSVYKSLIESDQFEQSGSSKKDDHPKKHIKTSITSDCIYHKGTFYQKGDIVALCDQDDGQVYFAQLTGFLQDQYCEKSASINWLVPTKPTSRNIFDPSAYKLALEDVQLRKLDCMTFIRHCPHDYYIRKFFQSDDTNAKQDVDLAHQRPLDVRAHKRRTREAAYILTTMQPCNVPSIVTIPE